jgi:tetratricopeptide (TPR) repeat protein
MRRVLLALLWCALSAQGVLAQDADAVLEPTTQTRAMAEAGDPYAQWELATFYRQRGEADDLNTSLDLFQKSLAGYQVASGASSESVPIILNDIAATQAMLGLTSEAIASYAQRAGVLSAIQPGSIELATALADLGNAYDKAADYPNAIAQYRAARAVHTGLASEPSSTVASLFVNEGIAWYNSKQLEKALDAYREGLEIYRSIPNPENIAICLSNIAGVLSELGRNGEAEAPRMEQVAVLRAAASGSTAYAEALQSLGRLYQTLARHGEALPLLDEARRLYLMQQDVDQQVIGDAYVFQGISHEAMSHYELAVASYEQAQALYEAATGPDSQPVAIALNNLQHAHNMLAHYAAAETAAKRSIAIYRRIAPQSDNLAYALQELAISYQKLSKYRESLPLIREARTIFLANHDDMTSLVGDTYLNEGISLEGLKGYATSLGVYVEATKRYEAANGKASIEVGYAINNTAWVYRRMGEYEQSEAAFRQALPILENNLGPTHTNTNKVYINIGIVSQLQGNNDEAIRWSMRALTNLNHNPLVALDDQRWTYNTLAKAFKGRSDARRAILFAKLAINAQQKIRSNNKAFKSEDLKEFKEEWQFLYQDLADLLIGEGRLAEAQTVLNMEKEEELINFVQRDATADLRDSEAALTPREDAQLGDVDALLGQPIAAASAVSALIEKKTAGGLSPDEQQKLDALQASLDDAYADFMDDVDGFLAATGTEDVGVQKEIDAINLDYIADTQEQLRSLNGKAAMLQIASLGEATHLFLTVPDASVHREVKIGRADLSRMVFDALSAIERRDPTANEKMRALYALLVGPVAGDLKASGAGTLMLNLQGFLRYVPFAALYDGKRYLIEDYALSLYTPAAKTEFSAGDRDASKSAGFGVTESHPGFAPLPGVARELEAIFGDPAKPGALKGAANLDGKFTRESFRNALQGRPEIVHIASHF